MNHLFKNLRILNSSPFKFCVSVFISTLFFGAVYYVARFDQIFQYNFDEGFYFMRAFLHTQGYALYQEILMDQPPALVKLLTFAFKSFGPSVMVARSIVLFLISVMMMCLFYIIYRTQNIFSAVMTMVLICSIHKFIQLSVSAMNGLPAIAFAVIACICVYFYEIHRKYLFLILSAFFLALGLQTKFFVFVFIPAILVELIYIEYKHSSVKLRFKQLGPMVIWGASLLIIYFTIAWLAGIDYMQIINPFSLAKIHYSHKPFVKVLSWITRNNEIILLAIGSLLYFRPKSKTLFFIPLIVTASSFLLFINHVPIWDHHRHLMLIPAAWLASFAVYEFFSLKSWQELKKEKTNRIYWLMFRLVYVGFAIIVVFMQLKSNAYLAVRSLDKTTVHDMRDVIELINQNKNEATVLVTDMPTFAFHTQVLIPPSLSTISEKQTRTGLITDESIVRLINEEKNDMILWARFPELGARIMRQVESSYNLVYQNDTHDLTLYFRKGLKENAKEFMGFGKNTRGGQGGAVYMVENLNPSGPGSLLEGIQKKGPRMIQFSVAGQINLLEPLIVKNPNVTINGASAPKPGITLAGAGIIIETSEVIVKHLKIRVGDQLQGPDPEDRDGIAIHVPEGATERIENIVIDHCSVSWAVDENIGTWIDGDAGIRNVTISHNIISEGLKSTLHPEGEHSMGLLIGDNIENVSIMGNVFAHNVGRNPQLKGGVNAEIVSNIMYNPGHPSIGLSDSNAAGPIRAQIVNNYFVPGTDTRYLERHISVNANVSNDSALFITNNHGPGTSLEDKWGIVHFKAKLNKKEIARMLSPSSLWFMGYSQPSFDDILTQAGALPDHRDEIDRRIISDVMNLTGSHINAPKIIGK